ncbi:MAG: MBL fold metallo-hydrolase [Gammaproteobacteria bacterium]|jgi:glyoxylase-like metal-dependent hydrolase (beta-lactamase superfamily II)|nr:MBL fold metallo-hydrolase [Gammaproteobacteria bacterium]
MSTITTIDCRYLDRAEFAAAYLLVAGDDVALVDNNTNSAVPLLLQALERRGLKPEQVRYLIVTHVHLDHAGATSTLAGLCPQATVIAHPRAARHLVDPARLVESASAVYGTEEFARLYGKIEPIAAERVVKVEDNDEIEFGAGKLRFLHTRGHANHHICIVDSASGSVFTGDAFGLHYPALQTHGTFAVPSTSPTDFEPELARQAVRRISELQPTRVYPTHFGPVTAVDTAAGQLIRQLDAAEQIMLAAAASDCAKEALDEFVRPLLQAHFDELLSRQFAGPELAAARELLALDIELNAQGIAVTAAKHRRQAAPAPV